MDEHQQQPQQQQLSAFDFQSDGSNSRPGKEQTFEFEFKDMSAASHHAAQITSSTKQVKLRSSCDSCGEAKIKCDRGQPKCARCVAQGTSCVYGVSRKAGKPRRRITASSRSPLPSTRAPESEKGAATATTTTTTATTSIDLTTSGNGSYDDNVNMDDIHNIMLTDGSPLEGHMTSIEFDSPDASYAALHTWFPFDGLGSLGNLGALGGDESCLSGQSSAPSSLMLVESPPTSAPPPPAAAVAPAPSTTAAPPGTAREDCTKESKEIMRRLYCANPSAPISDGVAARTLDLGSVLTRNRDVVERLSFLLKCPCVGSPHMAMLYSSIISRVLLWYQQAVWNANATTTGASPGSSSSSSSSFPPAAQERMSSGSTPSAKSFDFVMTGTTDNNTNSPVSVLPTTVMVGTFQSHDQTLQTALANRLILSELKKVRSLIEFFISLGTPGAFANLQCSGEACCAAAGDFKASVGTTMADANLFASLGGWLRSEHERIVWKARSGLSVLDESY
ncbi:hypothetical protein B0H63DRAFT_557561 [Podospora didyma]|uniref:Zn(2)-C6 fungal-type domain-containing protein n=1 Tax=Podospora didyma TaxID=330526 RepID=A0AAE0NZK0_9PEZI|nr:hypothetical protein B0H63DRAFT_557561 [Podospora didyma]